MTTNLLRPDNKQPAAYVTSRNDIPYGYCQCGCGNKTEIATKTDRTYGYVKGEPRLWIRGHNVSQTVVERFWSRVAITADPSKCWEWQGVILDSGYGQIRIHQRGISTHRLAYELTNGAIPHGLNVCHTCDNKKCCNPAHLFLGTALDNTLDKMKKGRQAVLQGESHGSHKLTAEQVLSIRDQHDNNSVDVHTLAREFGVCVGTISHIVKRRTWRHLNG